MNMIYSNVSDVGMAIFSFEHVKWMSQTERMSSKFYDEVSSKLTAIFINGRNTDAAVLSESSADSSSSVDIV